MQRLGLTLLACTLVLGVTASASASQARDEAAVRSLGDNFAKAFLQKNDELRASLFAENRTFVTPQRDFLQGRVAMVKDFGPEAEQAVNGTTQAAFSNYRIRFIKPDVAVADALLTVRNVNGPNGTVIPVIPIDFFYVAVRHGDKWLIDDGRVKEFGSVGVCRVTGANTVLAQKTVLFLLRLLSLLTALAIRAVADGIPACLLLSGSKLRGAWCRSKRYPARSSAAHPLPRRLAARARQRALQTREATRIVQPADRQPRYTRPGPR